MYPGSLQIFVIIFTQTYTQYTIRNEIEILKGTYIRNNNIIIIINNKAANITIILI